MFVRSLLFPVVALATVLFNGCLNEPTQEQAPNPQSILQLPGALQSLSTCRGAQSIEQLEVRTAISGGILDARSLALEEDKDGTLRAKADFSLDGVHKERTETLAIGVYGRVATTEEWVQLATLEESITLKPNETNTPKLNAPFNDGCGRTYDAGTGALLAEDSSVDCAPPSDLNRNARSNLEDFCNGALPSLPEPFIKISPSTVQFQSGIQLGEFARQVVLVENLSNEAVTLNAEVMGMPGMTIARLDPEYISLDGSARRKIENTEEVPFILQPLSEILLSLSYAPVNAYLAAGHLQISATNAINVNQAFDVTAIGNADGDLQPVNSSYDVIDAASELQTQLGLQLTPYPSDYLFSGLTFSAGTLDNVTGNNKLDGFTTDAAYYFEIPEDYRFSISLNGLTTDLDMGLFLLKDNNEITTSFLSENTGISSESIEWRNNTTATVKAILAIGKVGSNRDETTSEGALTVFRSLESGLLNDEDSNEDATDAFALGVHLFSGPEYTEATPMSPDYGPYEGGTTVTLHGRGFQEGAQVFVGNTKAFDVQVLNEGTEVRFTLPALGGGAQTTPMTVVLVNPVPSEEHPLGDGQACTLPESFTYLPPKPELTEVAPNTASTNGGTPVTFRGIFFSNSAGAPIICLDSTRLATQVNYISSSELQIDMPAYEDVDPGDTVEVSLTVRNWLVEESTLTDIERPTEAQLCNPNDLSTVSSISNPIAFTYQAPEANSPQPVLTSISEDAGSIDGGQQITVSGTDFRLGAIVYFGNVPGIASTLLAPVAETPSLTQIEVTTPAAQQAGNVDVRVVNVDDGQVSNSTTFTYNIDAPTVFSVLPNNGSTATENIVAVEGTGFRQDENNSFPKVNFLNDDNSYEATQVQYLNSGRVLATTPAGMSPGSYRVTLQNEDGQSSSSENAPLILLQDPIGPPPHVESISPASGEQSANTEVTLSGTHFATGTELFVWVGGQTIQNVTSTSDTEVSFLMPQSDSLGSVTIRVVNPDGQSATATFTYLEDTVPAPSLESINQTEWQIGDAVDDETALVLTFSQVQPGASFFIRPLVTEQSNIIPSSEGILEVEYATPCQDGRGPYVIELTNPDHQSVSVAYYCHPAVGPIALSITPTTLPLNRPLNETTLTMSGTGLGDLLSNPNQQAQLSLTHHSDAAHALSTVRETTEVPAYFQLQQSGSDNPYYYVERMDEPSFETELSPTTNEHFLPISLKSAEFTAPLVNYDGVEMGDTLTGYFYVMRMEEEGRQYLQEGTAFYQWKAFFSPIDLENVPLHANLERSDVYECSFNENDETSESSGSSNIASSATGEVDAVLGYPLHRPDLDGITGCTGTVLGGNFSCNTNITSVNCGPSYNGQNVMVTLSALTAMAPTIRNPYEILLRTDSNHPDTAILEFGKLTTFSTQSTPFENHEHASLSIALHDTTATPRTSLAQGLLDGYEYEFSPEPYWNAFFYSFDIPIKSLEGHEHVCATQEIEPSYTVGQVTISGATIEGDYLNRTYLGTIGSFGYDFYVDVSGQHIAHARTNPTPSPYASFYSQENSYLIFYNASVEGWSFYYDNEFSASYWTYSEPNYTFEGVSGWQTLGGAYGQYPSGTHDGDQEVGTINYTVSQDVPALYQLSSVYDGSLQLPDEYADDYEPDAILLTKDVMRLRNAGLFVNDLPLYNAGFCIKPMNQDRCQINSCDERTVIHFTGDYEQLSFSLSHGSDSN